MKKIKASTVLFTLLSVFTWSSVQAQDGSDIMYGKVHQLDSSFFGDYVHLDFYRKSKYGVNIDTIALNIDGHQIRFVEHRIDNGFNNWFDDQYLEGLDKIDGLSTRIVKSRLDSLTTDSVFVTNYLEFYDTQLVKKRSRQIASSFPKDIIVEVLISAKHHNERNK